MRLFNFGMCFVNLVIWRYSRHWDANLGVAIAAGLISVMPHD